MPLPAALAMWRAACPKPYKTAAQPAAWCCRRGIDVARRAHRPQAEHFRHLGQSGVHAQKGLQRVGIYHGHHHQKADQHGKVGRIAQPEQRQHRKTGHRHTFYCEDQRVQQHAHKGAGGGKARQRKPPEQAQKKARQNARCALAHCVPEGSGGHKARQRLQHCKRRGQNQRRGHRHAYGLPHAQPKHNGQRVLQPLVMQQLTHRSRNRRRASARPLPVRSVHTEHSNNRTPWPSYPPR